MFAPKHHNSAARSAAVNASNHQPGTPLDMISFHCPLLAGMPCPVEPLAPTSSAPAALPPTVYAQPSVRDGGANASAYEQMFSSATGWLNTVQNIVNARDAINPPVSFRSRGGAAARGSY